MKYFRMTINRNHCGQMPLYSTYTLIFVILSSVIFMPFFLYGKTFIWDWDGTYQYFNVFVYVGTYLRNIIRTLLFEHRLEIPIWDFSIGYGSDVLHTLGYYGIGDPFCWMSVLVPKVYAEAAYNILAILKLYLSGITFCAFSRKMNSETVPILCGTIIYVFSGWSITACLNPPSGSVMVYFPLLLLGVEKILCRESPVLFIFSVFLTCISNFYYFYILVILVILYVFVRLIIADKKESIVVCEANTVKRILIFVRLCMKFAGYALIGIMMAAIFFLPLICFFLDTMRPHTASFTFLFDKSYYESIFGGLIGTWGEEGTPYYHVLSFSPIVLITIFIYFFKSKEKWIMAFFCF